MTDTKSTTHSSGDRCSTDSGRELSVEDLSTIEQFVENMGGIEKAKLAVETLRQLGEAA